MLNIFLTNETCNEPDVHIFQVLIISYETFRIHADRFDKPESCDLLLCDEAHRLKNDSTLTNKVQEPNEILMKL